MNRKLKFLLTSQAFLILTVATIFYSLNPDFAKQIKTNSFETKQTQESPKISTIYNTQNTNQSSKSILYSIHNYIKNNQTSKALLLVDSLYKENPNSSLSYLVASHIFLLKDQNQLAYENLKKAANFSDFNKFNTHLDIQLNLILNKLDYFEANQYKLNLNDPNQVIHYIIYLSKKNNFKEIENLFTSDYLLSNSLISNLKNDFDYYKTFKDGNINMLYNLWAKTLIKDQYIHYARSLILDAIKNDASSHNSYLLLSYCYILSENYTEALEILNKSKKIDPYNQNINFYLAILNYQENNFQESLKHLDKVKDQNFQMEKIKLQGQNYYNLKNYQQAAIFLEKHLLLNPQDLKTIEYLLDIYFNQSKDLQKAYILVKNLEKLNSNSPNYYNLLGLSYLNLNNSIDASKNFTKALELDPNFYPAIFNQSKLLIKNNDLNLALENLEKGLKISQTHNDKKYTNKFTNEIIKLKNIN